MMEAAAAKVEHEPETLDGKVGAFYKSFMDQARIEKLGASAIAPQLEAVRKAKNRDELAALMGRTNIDFEGALFNLATDIDSRIRRSTPCNIWSGRIGPAGSRLLPQARFRETEKRLRRLRGQVARLGRLEESGGCGQGHRRIRDEACPGELDEDRAARPEQDRQPMTWNWRLRRLRVGELSAEAKRIIVAETAHSRTAAAQTPLDALKVSTPRTTCHSRSPTPISTCTSTLSGQQGRPLEAWRRFGRRLWNRRSRGRVRQPGLGSWPVVHGEVLSATVEGKDRRTVARTRAAYHAHREADLMSAPTRAEALKKLDTLYHQGRLSGPPSTRLQERRRSRTTIWIGNVIRAAAADRDFLSAALNNKPIASTGA